MNSEWIHIKTVNEKDYCGIDGINIWDYEWKYDNEHINVKTGINGELKSLYPFFIELPNRKVEFIAEEVRMGVYYIYIKKNNRIETKSSLKIKIKIARDITNEFDILGFIANGAPEDEYDSLSSRILSDIINRKGNIEIVENAFKLLTEYYGAETIELKVADFKVEIEKLSERIREKTYANTV